MTERRKDLLFLAALCALVLLFFSKILFTHQIIRAPDIINEYYWSVKAMHAATLADTFRMNLHATWSNVVNSGYTTEGGDASAAFLLHMRLLYYLLPTPSSVAWFIVLHLFFGGVGAYCCCRLIGVGRVGSFLAGMIFALAPENASLINAGHVMKIATISYAPWAFYFLEKGFRTRRVFWFVTAGFTLAFQFFNTHWQIAFYTCLAIGVYGIMRLLFALRDEREKKATGRLVAYNLALLAFFLTTVAISLAPLANWSKETNRGANSGANVVAAEGTSQAKGGLEREEAMSWSLPPEELAAFVIPGMFGYSRQEAGDNPPNIASYYWGRMNFTQTVSYMGLLPWLLLPLPLVFRRDRYTWLALSAVFLGVLFSMGKYTPFYNLLFDYFPGINRFRVPKMMMFIPVLGLGVLSAVGLDLLLDPAVRGTRAFKRYLTGVVLVPVALLVLLAVEVAGKDYWINTFLDILAQPTRYEPQSQELVLQRFGNVVTETGIAAGLAALCAAVLLLCRKNAALKVLPLLLLALYLTDVGRVNAKFMFLVDEPHRARGEKAPEVELLLRESKEYRVLPMGGDPMQYGSAGIPVMFTSNPVQQRRWQEFLDTFALNSAMPDMVNLKYLVFTRDEFEKQKSSLGPKYTPVFVSPADGTVVVLNGTVLPKAWLVPSAVVVSRRESMLGTLQQPDFDPRRVALVETPTTLPLADPGAPLPGPPGEVRVTRYEGETIEIEASVTANALLVLGEKYYKGWTATVDGKDTEIHPVNHILRGVYLTPGAHRIRFVFDPVPFKFGKALTLGSFLFFVLMLIREVRAARVPKPVTLSAAAEEAA